MGSTAGEVMENAPCPVLGIPEEATFDGQLDQIAFTTNFEEEQQFTLHLLQKMFSPFDPHFHCLNVDLAHTEEYTNRMVKFSAAFEGQDKMHFKVLAGTDIYEAVTDYMQAHHIDLLAMVTRKRNFLQELFHYSKTKQMVYHSHTPVLALHVE